MQVIEETKHHEDRYQLGTYGKIPISIERGQGSYVYDAGGTSYLDFYGGHAVASTGHCHPLVVKAIQEQAGQLIFYSNVVYNSARSRAAAKLVKLAGSPYHQVFFANSGGEANENAIKLARAATGRTEILSMTGSFHGRTYGSLSSTGIAKYRNYLNTPVPSHRSLPPEQVAGEISECTAGVLVEPIQSMGGVHEISPAVLSEIQEACLKKGTYLIFDEVQTGVARTGTFLYAGQSGIRPDMVTLAKGIASGVPAGALLVTKVLAEGVKVGDLGTTFGGGPLACAAMEATLDVIRKENLAENAARIGSYIKEKLRAVKEVQEVLGRGLLLGIQLKTEAKKIQKILLEKRILTGTSVDTYVLRLMPPLTVTREEVDLFLNAMDSLGAVQE